MYIITSAPSPQNNPAVYFILTEDELLQVRKVYSKNTSYNNPANVLKFQAVASSEIPYDINIDFNLLQQQSEDILFCYLLTCDIEVCRKYDQLPRKYIWNFVRYLRSQYDELGLTEIFSLTSKIVPDTVIQGKKQLMERGVDDTMLQRLSIRYGKRKERVRIA